jgi:hypothetical protein
VAKPRGTRPKARRRAAHDPPASGPKKRPCQAAHWRSAPGLERPGAAFKPEAPGNFLRLWPRDHLGSRWNHNVGARLGQVGTLLGLRLFQWRGRTDHVRPGNGDRLLGLRSVRHDAIRTRGAAVRSGARRSRILVVRVRPGAVSLRQIAFSAPDGAASSVVTAPAIEPHLAQSGDPITRRSCLQHDGPNPIQQRP